MSLIGSIDQGTSSSRFLLFDSTTAKPILSHQIEITQISPNQAWLEEDPEEIFNSIITCIKHVAEKYQNEFNEKLKIDTIGITNQRETTVIWDKITGKPLYNAILWCDARTKSTVDDILENQGNNDQNILQKETGLPISTYFSALKVKWMIDNVESVRNAVLEGRAMFGTIDTWLVYRLTNGKRHVTDATNACRTMLYDINKNDWSDQLLDFFKIPKSLILPEICPSSSLFGNIDFENCEKVLENVPITGILGDQQAALVGQQCLEPGMLKNTYGTGCFLLQNTGDKKIYSKNGLLTTVAYQKSDGSIIYALEGSIANAGIITYWLRDKLQLIKDVKELNHCASLVENAGGVVLVPAYSGLFCPYWDTSARGIICGLTQFSDKNHICRAALESVAWQVKDVVEAMKQDGQECNCLKADGGMTNSELLMQMQADILNISVMVPVMKESTALGAAVAAGMFLNKWEASGWEMFKSEKDGVRSLSQATNLSEESRESRDSGMSGDQMQFIVTKPVNDQDYDYSKWKKAIEKSRGWQD